MDIKIEINHKDAIIPYKNYGENVSYILLPAFDEDYIEIPPNEEKEVPLGFTTEYNEDIVANVYGLERLLKEGVEVKQQMVDSNYEGEWSVTLKNCNDKPVLIARYPNDFDKDKAIVLDYIDGIAQVSFEGVDEPVFEIVNNNFDFSYTTEN